MLCLIAGTSFSLSETLVSVGYENENAYSNSLYSDFYDAYVYMNSSGVNININQFWKGHNIGLFLQQSFLFPTFYEVKHVNYFDFDLMLFKYNIIIGPSFRFVLNDNFFLNLGAGFSFSFLVGNTDDKRYFFGLGVNLNANYDISDIMYIGIGSVFNINTIYDSSGKSISDPRFVFIPAADQLGFSFKPYLYIGFHFYNSVGIGKPK